MEKREFLKCVGTSLIGATSLPSSVLEGGLVGTEDNTYIEIVTTENGLIKEYGLDGKLCLFPNTYGEMVWVLAQVTKIVKGGLNQRVRFESNPILKTELTEDKVIYFKKQVEQEIENNPRIFTDLAKSPNKLKITI